MPAALIIAGSGPTDRDGNSAVPGHTDKVDTYRWLADQLGARGYASLRYDKFGAGATGLGPYTPTDLGGLSFKDTFVRHAQDALAYLAAQPGVDARRLIIIGHSEGGMIALAVATDAATAPKPAQLALLEPQYGTILGILGAQLEQKLREVVAAGALPAADGAALTAWMQAGIRGLIAGAPVPSPLVLPLPAATGVGQQLQAVIAGVVYNAANQRLLRTENELDPVAMAARVTAPGSVLITCGAKDWNTPCAEVARLAAAFPPGVARLVTLPDTVHELRDVGAADGTQVPLSDYPKLPFSPVLADALRTL